MRAARRIPTFDRGHRDDAMTILQMASDSPWWLKAGAQTILLAHIGGGTLGMISGAVAVLAKKGGRLHRAAGNVFFAAMLTMASIGAAVSPFLNDRVSTVAGVMTLYLIATGWMTVKRKPGGFEIAGLAVALGIVAAGAIFARMGAVDGAPPQAFYVFMIIGLVAALSDLKVILAGGIAGAPRIARHLWRMCTAWFVASGSFFLGQQKVMPAYMHGSPLLFIPALAPLLFLIVWMIKVRWPQPKVKEYA
jgi:uncharacterized membrane protein